MTTLRKLFPHILLSGTVSNVTAVKGLLVSAIQRTLPLHQLFNDVHSKRLTPVLPPLICPTQLFQASPRSSFFSILMFPTCYFA